MRIAFYTLGCKVNQYESQALKEKFLTRGYEIVNQNDEADIYVINTCTVTNLADRKSRQYIRRMKKTNPDSIIAVIGCYAQICGDEIRDIEGVNIILGTNEKNRLPDYIEEYMTNKNCSQISHIKNTDDLVSFEETGAITSMDSRTRALIKIQEGCNQFCSYCIIPYARGSIRSRAEQEIINEAQKLIEKGFKELVLTGINTALYGKDKKMPISDDQTYGIETVIDKLNSLPGDFRIRLGSLEPTVINAEYVKRLLKYDKLCPHMHLSLQSGSDSVLKRMNRNYDTRGFMDIVNILRSFDKGYGLTTDIIVGFPGETEEEFNDSLNMVKEIGFQKVHVFPYSRREGTKAASMPDQIPSEIKKRRSIDLITEAELVSKQFLKKQRGSVRKVLFEEYDERKGYIYGYSDNYVKVYYRIKEHKHVTEMLNRFIDVKFTDPYKEGVFAEC